MLAYLSNTDNEPDPEIKWVLVFTTNTEIEGNMYKANLEGAGIPVQVLSQVDSTRMFTVGDLAIVKIFVPEEYVSDALEIIQAIKDQ